MQNNSREIENKEKENKDRIEIGASVRGWGMEMGTGGERERRVQPTTHSQQGLHLSQSRANHAHNPEVNLSEPGNPAPDRGGASTETKERPRQWV
ncbi:hypothetical protein NDU88_002109 [Pleurodeles waltl]|uniref:Uncharacterized protein n=1 Tax=Pleurodeles waltl TaxID=8319 RepID=A0AAV7U8W3_PLEWA|nr:hypothetical protein NDU88_002109 [Pleurodeles waltl]